MKEIFDEKRTLALNNLDPSFKKIVQAVKDGVIGDNTYIYTQKINDSVEIQIRVEVKDMRMTSCMGLLEDWRKNL